MSNKKKRTYNSTSRSAQAALTRNRILMSARKLFQTNGFEGVTIEMLAQAAEVSMPTIYALFESKRGVLRALMDEALPPARFQALVEMVYQEKTPEGRLRLAAKISREMYDAEREQMALFQGASVLAPEFKAVEKEREERRYARQEKSLKKTADENALAKGLSFAKARDILWAFTGRDLYRMLVMEQGWSSDEYEQWLAQLLIKNLLNICP